MHVEVHYPAETLLPSSLSEAMNGRLRRAPEDVGEHVVDFADLPDSIDDALHLIVESIRIPGAWASVNGRPISTLTALWNRLDCYRHSLAAPDIPAYCRRRVAEQFAEHGCEAEGCTAPCRFLCEPCRMIDQSHRAPIVPARAEVFELLAEIEWCPHLTRNRLPAG